MQESPNTSRRSKILVVDDERPIRDLLFQILELTCDVTTSATAGEAMGRIEAGERFDVVLTDIDLGNGESGNDLVPFILQTDPDAVVVMISGNRDLDGAIDAMRAGAFDYVKKPFDLDYLDIVVGKACAQHDLLIEKRQYEKELERLIAERTEQVNYLSYYDPLTGLPNRALFEDRVSDALSKRAISERTGLIVVSIDGFSKVRQTLGHSNSDLLLTETGKRLLRGIGERSTVARYERDEFAVLVQRFDSDEDLQALVRDITDSIRRPFTLSGSDVVATCSIGVSIAPENGDDLGTLVKNASAALARAKKDGGDAVSFYTADMNERAMKRLHLESGLWRALERGEFQVHYQPKVSIETGRICGSEALVRWQHSDMGMVSPAEFIPLAEESGLIIPLGEWVMETAAAQTKKWRDQGFDVGVAVNLSARQLQQTALADTFIDIIERSGLRADQVNLEITESSVIRNAAPAIATLWSLKEKGVKISIDDFGTGYSSLSYLRSLPIDVIKIDKSFVEELPQNADDAALIVAITSLGHNLRMNVVAEGVETAEQLKFLERIGCDEYQGYYFSRPLDHSAFEDLLHERSGDHSASDASA